MRIESVTLENKEYFVIEKLTYKDNLYYILINENDNNDICIRKRIVENTVEYLVGLDDEYEFDSIMQLYLNSKKNDRSEPFFPIGTIVNLKDYNNKVMITGYLIKTETGKIYDYCGCDYPTGVLSNRQYLYFDKKNIIKIVKSGYMDDEVKSALKKVELAEKNICS